MLHLWRGLWLVLVYCSLCSPLQAYRLSVQGTAMGLEDDSVWVYCPAWEQGRAVAIGESGSFSLEIDANWPARFTLQYGQGFLALKTHLFAFADVSYQVILQTDSSGQDLISVRGGDRRGRAFRQAQDYLDGCYRFKSTRLAVLETMIPHLEEIFGIMPEDSFTQVFCQTAWLDYQYVMHTEYGQPLTGEVWDNPVFQALPIRAERFMGWPGYAHLMQAWELREMVRRLTAQGADFQYALADQYVQEQKVHLAPLHVGIEASLLRHFRYERLGRKEQELYRERLSAWLAQYAGAEMTEALQERWGEISADLLGQLAPDFLLVDTTGQFTRLQDWQGQKILLDVWASWCKPCREKNQLLKQYYEEAQQNGYEVVFVSVAVERQITDWQQAVRKDAMPWKQLLADDLFVEEYGIRQYPSLLLVNEQGRVQHYDSELSLEQFRAFCVGKQASINE